MAVAYTHQRYSDNLPPVGLPQYIWAFACCNMTDMPDNMSGNVGSIRCNSNYVDAGY